MLQKLGDPVIHERWNGMRTMEIMWIQYECCLGNMFPRLFPSYFAKPWIYKRQLMTHKNSWHHLSCMFISYDKTRYPG